MNKKTSKRIIIASILSVFLILILLLNRNNDLINRKISKKLFSDSPGEIPGIEKVIIPEEIPSQPNIIVILADDLGYGDIGAYGNSIIPTPALDRMAEEGMMFTDFYSSSPLCSPSRVGLLTGRYPLRSGITFPLQPGKDTFTRKMIKEAAYAMGSLGVVDMKDAKNIVKGLPQSEITIAEALKLKGYYTGAFGKWHLGDFVLDMDHHPHNHGFDTFAGFNASNDDWPAAYWEEETELIADIALDQSEYTRKFTDEAIDFIDRAEDRPFFLYLAHKDPHQPCFPSADFAGATEAGPHGDSVMEMDWNIQRLMDHLKNRGIDEDTLVIFTSDNGPWFDGSAGELRGRKGESFDGGFRVPMIVRWPGVIPGGAVSREAASNLDIFPTVMTVTGLSLPTDRIIDGSDLSGILKGDGMREPSSPIYFFHYNEVEAIRSGKWKYIRRTNTRSWPIPLDKKDTLFGILAGGADYKPEGSDLSVPTLANWPMLYNMETDNGENYNLNRNHKDIQADMDKQITSFEEDFFANPRGWTEMKK